MNIRMINLVTKKKKDDWHCRGYIMHMDFNIDIFINFHDRSRFIYLITLFLNKGDIRPFYPSSLSHSPLLSPSPSPTVMKNPGFIIGSVCPAAFACTQSKGPKSIYAKYFDANRLRGDVAFDGRFIEPFRAIGQLYWTLPALLCTSTLRHGI